MAERNEHKRAVRRAFNRAAASYDGAATVQRQICNDLAAFASAHLPICGADRVLDAGCGTGYGFELIARHAPDALHIALDFAPAMLARLPKKALPALAAVELCADIEAMPLADASLDAVWSSLALQWCDPDRALGEIARVLRPGGAAWIATLGPHTLYELREAFSAVDDAAHVIRFNTLAEWLRAAARAGFSVHAHANDTAHAVAADLRRLLHDIKAIGAHNVGPERRRASLGRAAWRTLERTYEAHRGNDGLLRASYDVILLALEKRSQSHG